MEDYCAGLSCEKTVDILKAQCYITTNNIRKASTEKSSWWESSRESGKWWKPLMRKLYENHSRAVAPKVLGQISATVARVKG